MPGRPSDPGDSLVPFSAEVHDPVVHPVRHGLRPPLFRVFVSWSRGNLLHVACLCQRAPAGTGVGEDGDDAARGGVGGKVVEVKLGGGGDGGISEAERRRIAYGSVPAFAMLQSRRNSLMAASRMQFSSLRAEWWQHILEYSNHIGDLLGTQKPPPKPVIGDPKMVVEPLEEPTELKAAWHLMQIFYADNESRAWLPESLVDWLEDYDGLLSMTESTIHSKLVALQKKLVDLQVIEDDPDYWQGLASALAVGWLDIVVKLLRLHGSYQPDQLDDREIENGLVEAVAVLVSTMPRLRPNLPTGKLGQCYKTKPDFVKAREKWQSHISKLDCSAFWIQCGHQQTCEGLRNLLRIMLGQFDSLHASSCHWMELYVSHFLYVQPFTAGLEGMHTLAQKCMQQKPAGSYTALTRILVGILGENTEARECDGLWVPFLLSLMVVHSIELLTADSKQADALLHEERYNLGGISIEELHRLVYAQVLSSHPLTWQIAPTYLASCQRQGLGLLEILLYKQPIRHYTMLLKDLEICRLYELENISLNVMKIAGVYHWKHGRKGFGVYWLQQAHDEVRLSRIAQQLFEHIGKSISDDSFKQWEGLIELLGSEVGSAGGLEFLHKYRDFKRSLQKVQEGRSIDAARKSTETLVQLMKSPSTPQRFWLPLLYDSVKLLNWRDRPLLTVSETNLLLNKLQELSMARLRPDFADTDLLPEALSSVRLALATNLGRAILEEC
ncbi:hypothetical protein Taro_035238 [Colocasia esculenta]|uniref:Nuclear pore complex protein Nup85 n=1 Tax=Colocasia esculenta TaxID=4460 RepID=A0A843W634_COLES|nr:hypothetical protein [Colocasia esculenta]